VLIKTMAANVFSKLAITLIILSKRIIKSYSDSRLNLGEQEFFEEKPSDRKIVYCLCCRKETSIFAAVIIIKPIIQVYKFDTRISEKGIVSLPFEANLFKREVEIITDVTQK
jgi:hypothetical protein